MIRSSEPQATDCTPSSMCNRGGSKMTTVHSVLFVSLLASCMMSLVHATCEAPDQQNKAMQVAMDCAKEFGTARLCVADCLGQRLGIVTEKGVYVAEKMEQMIETLPEGGLQEAFLEYWRKCAKSGKIPPINRKMPDCTGWTKMAKCFRKVVTQMCPELARMLDM